MQKRELRRAGSQECCLASHPPPFLLGGVIESHLDAWSTKYPDEVERLCRSFYVDDLLTGGGNVTEAGKRKALATEIMANGKFTLHKWHSNVTKLKEIPASRTTEDQTYYNNYKSRRVDRSYWDSSGTKLRTPCQSSSQNLVP